MITLWESGRARVQKDAAGGLVIQDTIEGLSVYLQPGDESAAMFEALDTQHDSTVAHCWSLYADLFDVESSS
jgi:hypothetical protein